MNKIYKGKRRYGIKCICQRFGTLGWYSNSSKEEVKKHAENNGIRFEENEDIQVVEEQ